MIMRHMYVPWLLLTVKSTGFRNLIDKPLGPSVRGFPESINQGWKTHPPCGLHDPMVFSHIKE